MDFEQQAVRSTRCGGQRHWNHQVAVAGGMGGIDDHRQVVVQLRVRDRGQVERVAQVRLKRPDSTLAKNHLLIASVEEVLGGEKPLPYGGAETALEQHGSTQPPESAQEREILHVTRAHLK